MFSTVKRTAAGIVSLAATLFFALLWVNNLIAAWRVHTALAAGRVELPQSAGIVPMLGWSVVDVSTVTTLIPFLGFFLIFIALLRTRRWESWPFFAGYDRFNIALGLLGTLWGIILIGFYPAKQVTIPALMNCLHTAMFSTLAAIIWVMILEPLVLLPLLRMLVSDTAAVDGDEGLTEELARTVSALRNLNRELERSGSDTNDLRQELAALVHELDAGRQYSLQWRNDFTQSLRTLSEIAALLQEQNKAVSAENGTLRNENNALRSENTLLRDDKTQVIMEKERALQEVEQLKTQLDSVRQLLR